MENPNNCTPPEMRESAALLNDQLLPQKSKSLYMKAYLKFKDWCSSNNANIISENVVIAYFQHFTKDKKASSSWAHYSMLKSTLSLKENVDISKYFKLTAFLKRQNFNYAPKKSAVFTSDEITQFLIKAPDQCYIAMKAALVIGVAGACRSDELCNMLVADLTIKDDIIIVLVRTSKNGSSRKFVIMDVIWIGIINKYLGMRDFDLPKLFVSVRNGKCTRQNIGHNTIGQMPQKIATFLSLANPKTYTGHSFRRTSATILASNGGNLLELKQHGGWKSSTVAEGYIEDSLSMKKSIAGMVQGQGKPTSTFVPASTTPCENIQLPSTSHSSSRLVQQSNTLQNENINIPATTSNMNSSLQMSGSGINMTCNNCTINYHFYK